MVKKKRYIAVCLFVCVVIFLCSCSPVWDSGHIVDGHYVPKKPNYKFKDKLDNIIPSNLDTVNVYRKVATYSDGVLNNMEKSFYLKFYPEGRVLEARVWQNESNVLQKSYQETLLEGDLFTTHNYYYSKDGEKIQIETFIQTYGWPTSGMYDIENYYLNATGDTLTFWIPQSRWKSDSDYKAIYVKEKMPQILEDYPVTW